MTLSTAIAEIATMFGGSVHGAALFPSLGKWEIDIEFPTLNKARLFAEEMNLHYRCADVMTRGAVSFTNTDPLILTVSVSFS